MRNFPDHIACDSRSKSEIAVPLKDRNDKIAGVMDVDSNYKSRFDQDDAKFLEVIVDMVYGGTF